MIIHQTIGVTNPGESLNGASDKAEEMKSIIIGIEDLPAFITAAGNVAESARVSDAKWTCHHSIRGPTL
jgi:hypothetical protein